MRFKGLQFVFVVLVTVNSVKGECDTYLKCLGSFFDSFFTNHKNFKTETQIGNISIPGFDVVDMEIENASINKLLSSVSDFIQEELNSNVSMNPQINVFQNIGNNTAIYVKSITINNNFEISNHKNDSENIAFKDINNPKRIYFDSLVSPTTFETTESSNIFNVTMSTQLVNKVDNLNKVFVDKKIEENEISDDNDPLDLYYDMEDEEDNGTDYLKIDYLEMYKDTTNEYIGITPTELPIDIDKANKQDKENKSRRDVILSENIQNNVSVFIDEKCINNTNHAAETIFPWVAAIFIKNDTSNQFDYYCDGALLSESIVLTAARCMEYYGSVVDAKNLLVLLGKSSLQSMSGTERAVKVNSIIKHENFTQANTSENDIAILIIEAITLNEHIQTACLGVEEGSEAVTTGWAITGEITIIPLDEDNSENCEVQDDNTFCAVYGNDATVCPSYGGIYAVRQGWAWYLQGIRSGDPSDRGMCFNRNLHFTDLMDYGEWLDIYIN